MMLCIIYYCCVHSTVSHLLSSVFVNCILRLREMLTISFNKHRQEHFCECLLYSDVMTLLDSKPTLQFKSIVGVIHSGSKTAQTIINILHVIKQDCIYVPISIFDFKLQTCDEIVVSVEQCSLSRSSFPGHQPVKRHKGRDEFCSPCLETLIKHCHYCASWVRLAKKLNRCKVDFCLVDKTAFRLLPHIPAAETILVTISVSNPSCTHGYKEKQSLVVPHQDLAYIFTTSGTTGIPKSVSVPNSSIIPNIINFHEKLQLKTSDKVLSCSPLTFDPSIIEIFLTVLAGASFVFVEGEINDPRTLRKHISESTVLMCTPSLLRILPEPISKILKNLRILALGGEMFPLGLVNEHYCKTSSSMQCNKQLRIFNFYGITEQSCWSFIHEFTRNDINLQNVPLGEPVPGTKYCVTNGELCLGGDRRCYIDEKLAPEWYATGDMVLVRDGRLYISGRINRDQVKINGKKMCRVVIQRTIKEIFSIESHVKFIDNRVYLFLFSDLDLPECKLRSELKKVLPPHYKFDKIKVASDKIPMTLHLKIDEKKLCCDVLTLGLTEANLNNTVREFVMLRGYCPYDSCQILVNLGLDSLDMMQLSNYLLDIFPTLASPTDTDSLLQTLFICPLDRLWETLPKQVTLKDTQVPSVKTNKLTVISRANLSLCVDSSPVVFTTSTGLVRYCVGSHSGVLFCGTIPESTEIWRCQLPDRIESSPCFLLSHVYVGCYDGFIYVVSSHTGTIEYSVRTGDQVKCSPSIDISGSGSVYCGSHDGKLYKVSPHLDQGSTNFVTKSVEIDNKPISASVLVLSSVLVACSLSGKVTALNKKLDHMFSNQFNAPIFSSPVSSTDESSVFIALVTGDVLKLSTEDFSIEQKIATSGLIYSNLVHYNSKLYITSHDQLLHCYPDSLLEHQDWSCTTPHKVSSSPALVRDSAILVTSTDGTVSVVEVKDGQCISSFALPGKCFSSPRVSYLGSDVYCVVGCRDNYCYVLKLCL